MAVPNQNALAGPHMNTGGEANPSGRGETDVSHALNQQGSISSSETRLDNEHDNEKRGLTPPDSLDEKPSGTSSAERPAAGRKDTKGVDVDEAQAAFAEMSHKLTRASSRFSDVERGETEEDDFDLVAYLVRRDHLLLLVLCRFLTLAVRAARPTRRSRGGRLPPQGARRRLQGLVGRRRRSDATQRPNLPRRHQRMFVASCLSSLPDRKLIFSSQCTGLLQPVFFIVMKIPKLLPPPKQILTNFNGILKPGEMCLVLGRPGSGCSTFLKVIANQRVGFNKIDGEVTYGGETSKLFGKRYLGEVVYNQGSHPLLLLAFRNR